MSALPTKRAFLASITNPATGEPFAKADTVGKFSAAANAFAAENADKWSEPVKAAPVPRAPRQPASTNVTVGAAPRETASASKAEAKIIRAWAKTQDGLSVGDRGRIHADVIAAYRAAHGQPTGTTVMVRPTPNIMPKRTNISGLAELNGIIHRQDICGNRDCGKRLPMCQCVGGPVAFSTFVPLVLE